MGIVKKRIRIGNMTCINCQNKIQRKLKNTAGIQQASVSYQTGLADITYDSDVITLKDIRAIIEKLGYEALTDTPKTGASLKRLIGLPVIIIVLYVLLQQFGILNLLVPGRLADSKMGYGMLFIIGLLTSVHCIAMCGGIALTQCLPQEEAGQKKDGRLTVLRPALLYNLGRVISYTAIGFLLGAVGMLIGTGTGSGLSTLLQGILKLIAGALMVIMGINMLGIFPWLRRIRLHMPRFAASGVSSQKKSGARPLAVGLLNGLMPCGPLQSMQIVALASASPLAGALSMLLFSLGTVPLMLGLGSLVSALGRRFSQKVMNIGAVLVVVLGLAMLSQGGSLSGLLLPDRLLVLIIMLCIIGITASLPFKRNAYRAISTLAVAVIMVGGSIAFLHFGKAAGSDEISEAAGDIELSDGVQIINSTLTAGKYPNITVQAGIPVKWIIDAPAGSINGCNYRMLLKEYDITHEFSEGENIIEFLPTETGTIQYTCWMGMIHGNIFVVDGEEASVPDGQTADVPVPSGYQIPSEQLAVAQASRNESGQDIQTVSIELTENGFSPAVVVVEPDLPVIWVINNTMADTENITELLAPAYATKLYLVPGENTLYLYPDESFEISTSDNKFYAYVKVVDDLAQIDEEAIRQEVDAFETLIYPAILFESSGMSCCGG